MNGTHHVPNRQGFPFPWGLATFATCEELCCQQLIKVVRSNLCLLHSNGQCTPKLPLTAKCHSPPASFGKENPGMLVCIIQLLHTLTEIRFRHQYITTNILWHKIMEKKLKLMHQAEKTIRLQCLSLYGQLKK